MGEQLALAVDEPLRTSQQSRPSARSLRQGPRGCGSAT